MFSEEIKKYSWDDTTRLIYSKTDEDVRRALSKTRCGVDDFMALISPAAEPYLETMARLSRKYTQERFGNVMSMFIPLYLTNSCTNSCVYCGFHVSNKMKRTILTPEEMVNEYKAIKRLAPFENLLIVTGENPVLAGVPYLAKALDLAKPYFFKPQDRGHAAGRRRICRTPQAWDERGHLLSGNLQRRQLQHLSPAG